LFGLTDAYQEILRSSNIGSIDDVELERALLSNCGGLLDEIVDEDEIDSYASDDITTQHPSSTSNIRTVAAADLLAFIDDSNVVTPTGANAQILSASPAVSISTPSSSIAATSAPSAISRLPMRHEIVQILAEAAERHSASNMEIPTSTSSVIPHELVLTM
jgi:hypothetical protein